MLLPFLSESDPAISSEGSLDPLGLYPISDRLATRMVPGFRERMQHPRFLTAIAVGAVICSEFDDDVVASDGVTPPYQVFEWYIIQGLTRVYGDGKENRGLNGREKASSALRDGAYPSLRPGISRYLMFSVSMVYIAHWPEIQI